MCKIKKFFQALWNHITLPYYWVTSIGINRKLRKLAKQAGKILLSENDVEFLKTVGVETDLKTLKNGGKSVRKNKL